MFNQIIANLLLLKYDFSENENAVNRIQKILDLVYEQQERSEDLTHKNALQSSLLSSITEKLEG